VEKKDFPSEKLLKRRRSVAHSGWVILVEKDSPGRYGTEFVTWIQDEKGNRFWGHYFGDDREVAEVDFEDRH